MAFSLLTSYPSLLTFHIFTQSAQRTFQLQQAALPLEAAGKSAQGCIGGDDPMAGYEQRNRVGAKRIADCARRLRLAEAGGDPLIGAHAAVGNVDGGPPHGPLKRRGIG